MTAHFMICQIVLKPAIYSSRIRTLSLVMLYHGLKCQTLFCGFVADIHSAFVFFLSLITPRSLVLFLLLIHSISLSHMFSITPIAWWTNFAFSLWETTRFWSVLFATFAWNWQNNFVRWKLSFPSKLNRLWISSKTWIYFAIWWGKVFFFNFCTFDTGSYVQSHRIGNTVEFQNGHYSLAIMTPVFPLTVRISNAAQPVPVEVSFLFLLFKPEFFLERLHCGGILPARGVSIGSPEQNEDARNNLREMPSDLTVIRSAFETWTMKIASFL